MKEELQSKLVEILGSIQTAAGKAGDFAMVQLPDIAQSYVMYGRAFTTTWVLISLAIACLGIYTVRLTSKRVAMAQTKYEADKAASGNGYISRGSYFEWSDVGPFPFLPFILSAVLFGVNLQQLLLVWFAPKVWLLKEIAGLIK